MGRKSSLTDKQWEDIGARLIAGEKAADLARKYGINRAAITRKFSQQIATVKNVANQILAAESALKSLPVAQQVIATSLVDELRAMSIHAASAGKLGLMTAHRCQAIANEQVQKIDDADPESTAGYMKTVMALSQVANESSKIGLNLLNANKDMAKPEKGLVESGLDSFYGDD